MTIAPTAARQTTVRLTAAQAPPLNVVTGAAPATVNPQRWFG
jgi:hypothetical protein